MSDADRTQKNNLQADLVPVRWWQAITFLRLNVEIVRGIDPLADRILAHPWALSSLLEYAYMLKRFFSSNTHFVFISGEQAGLLWTVRWSEVFFIITLGLFPRYQQHGVGTRTVDLVEGYARGQRCKALAAVVAPSNKPVLLLIKACGAGSLGLATANLTLLTAIAPASSKIKIERVKRAEAVEKWRRWRLYEVEQVAGQNGLSVAATLLKFMPLPRGEYLTLHQGDEEIGFAFARQVKGQADLELGLFPSAAYWSGSQTGELVASLTSHLASPVRKLTLTRTHADQLGESASFKFERKLDEERFFAFKLI